MKVKKIISLIFLITLSLTLTACNKKDSIIFKEDYESLNGKSSASGKEHRLLEIPNNNQMIISTAEEIVTKIENKDTFYVYFGSKLCPWCRSVIEKAIEVSKLNGIEKIYYVDIWDDEGNEILRDKYTLDDNGETVKLNDGTEAYNKLLEYLANVLPDYTYAANKNGGNKLDVEEKRIYVPAFIYIASGNAIRYTTGISDLQTSSREELTNEMLTDEENLFDNFFINVCDESC